MRRQNTRRPAVSLVMWMMIAGGCYGSHSDGDESDGDPGDVVDLSDELGEVAESFDIPEDGPTDQDGGVEVVCGPAMSCDSIDCPLGMMLVPCGPFVMGSDPGEGPEPDPAEQPEHIVCLSTYCIDRTEVSWEHWDACQHAGGCEALDPGFCPVGRANEPITCVPRTVAAGFCAWAGKRLPTEAEWEKAARGGCEVVSPPSCGPEDERTYPWGEEPPTCDRANLSLWRAGIGPCMPFSAVGPVDNQPAGASPYGVLNLIGNAEEVLADEYSATYYSTLAPGAVDPQGPTPDPDRREWRVYRGGDSLNDENLARLAIRRGHRADNPSAPPLSGFRCVYRP